MLAIGGNRHQGPASRLATMWRCPELERDYDAIFLGMGLGPDKHLGIPGEDLANVFGAVEFIEAIKLKPQQLDTAQQVVVVGGGNTAIDAVREAVGLGFSDVVMAYRGTEPKMSGYAHEWKAAKVEGVRAAWGGRSPWPTWTTGTGKVAAVRCQQLDDTKQPDCRCAVWTYRHSWSWSP